MEEVIERMRQVLPPLFLGSAVDGLTGHVICWRTVQNKRALRQVPDSCFLRSGPRILVKRDEFLSWWGTTLGPARATAVAHLPPVPRAGQRSSHKAEA